MCSLNRSNKGYVKRKKTIKNWDWSPFELDVDVENFAFFIRSSKMRILNISSASFLPHLCYTRLEK